MKSLFFSLIILSSISSCFAQSPFKKLPKPIRNQVSLSATPTTMTAWRFTGPMGGYLYGKGGQQVVTGLGFGYSSLKFIDSTQKWYTNFSVNGVAFAGGNVAPTINPFTVMSVGLSLGILNQLIQVGPVYNFSGSFGVFASISVNLSN